MVVRAGARTTIRKIEGGLPHSEIPGSKLVRSSPRLIAAYHVLRRLSAPRHPPDALQALDRSRDRCPPQSTAVRLALGATRSGRKKTSDQTVSSPIAVCLPNMPHGSRSRSPCGHIPSSRCKISSPSRPRSGITRSSNRSRAANFLLLSEPRSRRLPPHGLTRAGSARARGQVPKKVEPDGIEPTTSCLQSTRSPS
jgi:hypothetical protein